MSISQNRETQNNQNTNTSSLSNPNPKTIKLNVRKIYSPLQPIGSVLPFQHTIPMKHSSQVTTNILGWSHVGPNLNPNLK